MQCFQKSIIISNFYMIYWHFSFSFSKFFAFKNIYLMPYIDYSLDFEEINPHIYV